MNKIKVIKKVVGEEPEVVEIEDTLKSYQSIVGGYIECVRFTKDITIVCNDEGKLIGLEPNFYMMSIDEVICGDVVFVGVIGCDFCSLNDKQIAKILNCFVI